MNQLSAFATRIARAVRSLPPERRLAAAGAFALFAVLFLPWYQSTLVVVSANGTPHPLSETSTGWGSFSFVEAAVLLVAGGVLALLLERAEGRAFHVPGGDGGVVAAAGAWTCVLVVWRIFDKQGTSAQGRLVASSGIEWGILAALAAAAFLTWSGLRMRAAGRPEPPLPGEAATVSTERLHHDEHEQTARHGHDEDPGENRRLRADHVPEGSK